MPLPDPRESRAVLIGTAGYRNLPGLPAVAENVERLLSLLMAPDLWGLPRENCHVLLDMEHPSEVLGTVHEAAKAAKDTLVVYYAGHGLRDPRTDELFLALPGSTKDRLFASVRYDDVRTEILQTAAKVPSKVVILDCCYSGVAMKGTMGESAEIADQARIEGTYLMTASASTVVALAPEGERFTAFTGEIVEVFERGIPDGPDLLNMEKLYWHVRAELESKGRPVPQQRAGNSGGMIALVRNRRATGDSSSLPEVRPKAVPEVPVGFEATRHGSPQEIVSRIDGLVGEGRREVAVQLLAAIATRSPGQEVAGLLGYLRRTGRQALVGEVFDAVVGGAAEHAVEVVAALREIDQPEDIGGLLKAAARGPVQELARLAQLFREAGQLEDTERLLGLALIERPAADAVISLVGALWAAGLGADVECLLGSSVIRLKSAETMTLAKALDSAGRAELAVTLYMRVLDVVVLQPDPEIAALLRTAREAARVRDANRLIDAALETRSAASEFIALATALWSVGLDEDADRVLSRAATQLPDGDVILVAAQLRSLDRADAALRLYTRAAEHRSGTSVVGFVDALRDLGRPVDGNSLLTSSASWAAPVVAEVITELLWRGRTADAVRVSAAQADRSAEELADIVNSLQLGQSSAAEWLVDEIVRRGSGSYVLRLAAALQQAGWSLLAEKALAELIQNHAQGVGIFTAGVPTLREPVTLAFLDYVARMPVRFAVAVAKRLDEDGNRAECALVVEAICSGTVADLVSEFERQDWPRGVDTYLEPRANISRASIANKYRSLSGSEQEQKAIFLLDTVAVYRVAVEIPALIKELHERGKRVAADRVIQTAALRRNPEDFAAILGGLASLGMVLRRRYVGSFLETGAKRPPQEIEAITVALGQASLGRYVNQLSMQYMRNSRPI